MLRADVTAGAEKKGRAKARPKKCLIPEGG
jgi:hypothetical protein